MLGSYQADALQNITGEMALHLVAGVIPATPMIGAFAADGSAYSAQLATLGTATSVGITFNASRVARTSVETRGPNAGLSPVIIV